MNNGGYHQFFTNSSREFASTIVDALQRIGCSKTADITHKATKALVAPGFTAEATETAMSIENETLQETLGWCDHAYYKTGEAIAEQLFEFIKRNKAGVRL